MAQSVVLQLANQRRPAAWGGWGGSQERTLAAWLPPCAHSPPPFCGRGPERSPGQSSGKVQLSFMKRVLSHSVVSNPETLWTVCSPSGSSVHRVLQARILGWVAMPSSRASSRPTDRTTVSYISLFGGWVLYHQHPREALRRPEAYGPCVVFWKRLY